MLLHCSYLFLLYVHISKRTPQDTRAHVHFFHEWLVSIRYIMKIMMDPRINKCILVLGIIFISLLVQASQEQNRFKFYTKALFVSLAHLLHSGDALQEPLMHAPKLRRRRSDKESNALFFFFYSSTIAFRRSIRHMTDCYRCRLQWDH